MQSSVEVAHRPDAIIIFNHIPKTGGTSLIRFFNELFGEDACYRHRNRDSKTNTHSPAIENVSDEERSRLRFLAGHFQYGKHLLFPRPHVYLGFVRDPVERFLSDYYFIRSKGAPHMQELALKHDPDGYLQAKREQGTSHLKNWQILSLTGREDIDSAMMVIEREYLVGGAMHQLDDAQDLLATVFERPDLAPVRANVTKDKAKGSPEDVLSRKSINLIRAHTAVDQEFIKRLTDRFERVKDRMLAGFATAPALLEKAPKPAVPRSAVKAKKSDKSASPKYGTESKATPRPEKAAGRKAPAAASKASRRVRSSAGQTRA